MTYVKKSISLLLIYMLILSSGIGIISIADIDNDGDLEIDSKAIPFLENWPQSTERFVALSPSILDIDNDDDLELVASDESSIYVWNHDGTLLDGNGNGIPDWPQQVSPYGMYFAPALADIDNDGDFEIFVGGKDKMSGLHHDGTLVDGWPFPITAYLFQTSPSIGDIDNDGDLEIVAATRYPGEIYVWNHNGTLVDGWPKTLNCDIPKDNIALADLDGDNDLEIILTDGMYIYVWNHDGTDFDGDKDGIPDWPFIPQPWGQQIPGYPGTYYNNPMAVSVGDVGSNGDMEIVSFTYNYAYEDQCKRIWIHIFNSNGTEYDGFPIEIPYLYGWHRCGITLADIDNDNYLEMIVPTLTKLIIARVNGSYSLLPEDVLPDAPYIGMRGSIVADIDGDDDMEILSPILLSWDPYSELDDEGILYAWHHDSSEVLGFPKVLPGPPTSMLSINDFDQDGDIELAGGYKDPLPGGENENGIYVLDLESHYNRNKVEWGTFAHDERNTGLYTNVTHEPEELIADAHGPYNAYVDEDIHFTGSASGGTPNYSYHWDFGNDDTSDEQNPTYNYSEVGVYTVNLTVTDSGRAIAYNETAANITEKPNELKLEITEIAGGMGVTATIKNVGEIAATNLEWNIEVTGGFLGRIDADEDGNKSSLAVNATEDAVTGSLGFLHLGPLKINVTAEADNADKVTAEATAFIVGPFVLMVQMVE